MIGAPPSGAAAIADGEIDERERRLQAEAAGRGLAAVICFGAHGDFWPADLRYLARWDCTDEELSFLFVPAVGQTTLATNAEWDLERARSCGHPRRRPTSACAPASTGSATGSEHVVVAAAEHAIRRAGAEIAFATVMGAGPRTARATFFPSDRPMRRGDLAVLDCGARVAGYHGDMCRTVAIGGPDAVQGPCSRRWRGASARPRRPPAPAPAIAVPDVGAVILEHGRAQQRGARADNAGRCPAGQKAPRWSGSSAASSRGSSPGAPPRCRWGRVTPSPCWLSASSPRTPCACAGGVGCGPS